LAAALEYLPAEHDTHDVVLAEYVPAAQPEHTIAPVDTEIVPAAHAGHTPLAAPLEYVPARQDAHDVVLAEYVPAAQPEHTIAPVDTEIVPAAHDGQLALATALEYEPAAQDAQVVPETKVPGPQGMTPGWNDMLRILVGFHVIDMTLEYEKSTRLSR
jgi:hypothetical protein